MKSELNEVAWAIYKSAFEDGQKVVVEDDQGDFVWGTLKTHKDGITLSRIEGSKDRRLRWKEIVFMANDGFPVRAINDMSYEDAVKFCWNLPTATFRKIMSELADIHEDRRKKKAVKKRTVKEEQIRRTSFGGGCPFVFEDVEVTALHFPGNNGPEYWGANNEETLVLESRDGAIMHSFDMSHLFLFDGLKLPYMDRFYEPDAIDVW